MHREIPSRIRDAVGWVNRPDPTTDVGADAGRVLPDGCMDLMWIDGRLLVSGADTSARPVPTTPGTKVGLRLAPGHLPLVLGLPAAELVDQQVRVADLPLDAAAMHAVEQAERRLSSRASVEALEDLARDLGVDRVTTEFADLVARRAGQGAEVNEIADELGLSTRQLHRRSLSAFGYGPKVLGRVLRLQRALLLGRHERRGAEVAAVVGFADQAHLARETRALAGTTWTELVDR